MLGEVVPVELRFYFDAKSYPVRLPDRPSFSGDGFTVMRFSKPIEKQQEIDGNRPLQRCHFSNSLFGREKSGTLEIPPATSPNSTSRQRPFGNGRLFGGFFGNTTRGHSTTTVPTQSAKVDVKPLPKRGPARRFQWVHRSVLTGGSRGAEAGCGY